MESAKKAQQRLWSLYPKVFATCGNEATIYGQCVAKYMGDVQKGQCDIEFQKFKVCIQKNAKKWEENSRSYMASHSKTFGNFSSSKYKLKIPTNSLKKC